MFSLSDKLEFIYYWMLFVHTNKKLDISNDATILNPHQVYLYGETFYSESEFEIFQKLIQCEKLWEDVYAEESDFLVEDLKDF